MGELDCGTSKLSDKKSISVILTELLPTGKIKVEDKFMFSTWRTAVIVSKLQAPQNIMLEWKTMILSLSLRQMETYSRESAFKSRNFDYWKYFCDTSHNTVNLVDWIVQIRNDQRTIFNRITWRSCFHTLKSKWHNITLRPTCSRTTSRLKTLKFQMSFTLNPLIALGQSGISLRRAKKCWSLVKCWYIKLLSCVHNVLFRQQKVFEVLSRKGFINVFFSAEFCCFFEQWKYFRLFHISFIWQKKKKTMWKLK